MLLFFIKDDEDTLPNATFVLVFRLIQLLVSSLLSLIASATTNESFLTANSNS